MINLPRVSVCCVVNAALPPFASRFASLPRLSLPLSPSRFCMLRCQRSPPSFCPSFCISAPPSFSLASLPRVSVCCVVNAALPLSPASLIIK